VKCYLLKGPCIDLEMLGLLGMLGLYGDEACISAHTKYLMLVSTP